MTSADRPTARLLIAVALLGYGVYCTSLVFGMLFGAASLLLLVGFVCQALFAFVAAFGVWGGQHWAASVVVMLGISIAATWVFEGFVLQIVGYLYALLVAFLAIVLALVLAAFLRRDDDRRPHAAA